jgi:hypothetical protein
VATTLALHRDFFIQTTCYQSGDGYAASVVVKWHEGNVTRVRHLSPSFPTTGVRSEQEAYSIGLAHAKAAIDRGEVVKAQGSLPAA